MASYHFAVQVIGRRPRYEGTASRPAREQSAVAAAAYRARCELRDERTGRVENYSHKGGFQHAEILLPDGAAPWLADREKLWNHVERLETRKDAQLCREINLALPHEVTDAQRFQLVRDFVQAEFVSRGMVADVAWHRPVRENGDDPRNFHAHIMLTLRKATAKGLHPVKTREWNARALLTTWREAWCDHQNSLLREVGSQARVDHRSLREQADDAWYRGDRHGWERLQRHPEIHVGPRARQALSKPQAPPARDKPVGAPREKFRGQQYGQTVWIDVRRPPPGRPARSPHSFGYVSEAEREARREKWRAQRRTVYYSQMSYTTRLSYLTNILLANDRDTKLYLVRKERQLARLERKLDYWMNGIAWKMEGTIRGRHFRFARAQAAAEARDRKAVLARREAFANKRAELLRGLTGELHRLLAAVRGAREVGLQRQREVANWQKRLAARQRTPLWGRTPGVMEGLTRRRTR